MLDRTSPVPLYYQLKELLLERIENGDLQPGDRLPSERELCEQFNVSRITAKEAINQLVQEHLVYRTQGKGTFVAPQRIRQGLLWLTSFTEDMQARGMRAGARVLEKRVIKAGKKLALALQLPEGSPVIKIKRLRLADGEPMGLQTSHVPYHLAPDLVNVDLTDRSLYEVLEHEHGLRLIHARESYTPIVLDRFEASLLRSTRGTPGLYIERTVYGPDGRPIEFVQSIMRGDRYTLYVESTRHGGRRRAGGESPEIRHLRVKSISPGR